MIEVMENKELYDGFYSESYTKHFFNKLSESYFLTQVFSSGLANLIRKKCISLLTKNLKHKDNLIIADFMSGSGENNRFFNGFKIKKIINIDFSDKMIELAKRRKHTDIIYLNENVLKCSLKNDTAHGIISTFGLKTLSEESTIDLAKQTKRVLKEKGSFCFSEFNLKGFTKLFVFALLFFQISICVFLFPFHNARLHYNFLSYSNNFSGNKAYKIFKQEFPNAKKINMLNLVIFIYGTK
ncbi:MAG: class I SAM-dependent methyltransferase [Flavobacteriales bacterium]